MARSDDNSSYTVIGAGPKTQFRPKHQFKAIAKKHKPVPIIVPRLSISEKITMGIMLGIIALVIYGLGLLTY